MSLRQNNAKRRTKKNVSAVYRSWKKNQLKKYKSVLATHLPFFKWFLSEWVARKYKFIILIMCGKSCILYTDVSSHTLPLFRIQTAGMFSLSLSIRELKTKQLFYMWVNICNFVCGSKIDTSHLSDHAYHRVLWIVTFMVSIKLTLTSKSMKNKRFVSSIPYFPPPVHFIHSKFSELLPAVRLATTL